MMIRGFTLVEILISLAIISIVTGFTIVNFRNSHESLVLDRAASKLAQDIRRSAEMALQAKQVVCASGTLDSYGVYMLEGEMLYTLYANCNGTANPGYNSSPGNDQALETIFLEAGVDILDVQVSIGDDVSISFVPPDPTVVMCGNDNCSESFTTVTIRLRLVNNPSFTKDVYINEVGFVDVN